MKRQHDENPSGSPKRQRQDGLSHQKPHSYAHDSSGRSSYNKNDGRADGQTRSDGYGEGAVKLNHIPAPTLPKAKHSLQTNAPSADPAATLESLLTNLTARPDVVKKLLGRDALKSAVKLLDALSSRDQTATASLNLFQPETLQQPILHDYSPASPLSQSHLPPLPEVPPGPYSEAPFTHKSVAQHDRVSAAGDLTYERLEFLGDAYIEVIATRLIFSRYPYFAAGRQAQIRERLVKNETLTEFSRAYCFRDRLHINDQDTRAQNPKGAGKILADVFEAYVAAVVLSDPVHGFERAENWLTELWAPILLKEFAPISETTAQMVYNSNAKQELQQKILGRGTKLDYREERPMEQSKHTQKYFVALYLTGWGYETQFLGYGEGQNKVEAGNRAAMQAMILSNTIVEDAASQLATIREDIRRQKEMEKEHVS